MWRGPCAISVPSTMEATGALGGGLLDVSVPDVRGPDNGAFSDICHTAKISSCLQEITEVGIPIVNASRDDPESCTPNTKTTVSYR